MSMRKSILCLLLVGCIGVGAGLGILMFSLFWSSEPGDDRLSLNQLVSEQGASICPEERLQEALEMMELRKQRGEALDDDDMLQFIEALERAVQNGEPVYLIEWINDDPIIE